MQAKVISQILETEHSDIVNVTMKKYMIIKY